MGWLGTSDHEPTPEEFFAGCQGDPLKMLDRVMTLQARDEYVSWECFFYMQKMILLEQRNFMEFVRGKGK